MRSQLQFKYPFEHWEFSVTSGICSEGGVLAKFAVCCNSICWGFEGGFEPGDLFSLIPIKPYGVRLK